MGRPARLRWLAVLALLPSACHSGPAPTDRPNVIVFLVDDLGWQDVGVPFGPERTAANDRYQTPNLQRLCREGTRFTDAYAHTVCSPSRVSLLTGVAAARHGVTHWTLKQGERTDRQPPDLQPPRWNWNGLQPAPGVPDSFVVPAARTLPGRFAAAGYRTIAVGKAHFGAIDTPGAEPTNLGFHANVAGHAAGAPSSHLAANAFLRNDRDRLWQVPGLAHWHGQDRFLTDVLTVEARAQLAAAHAAGQPFFLYLAHYAIHTPLDADRRYVQKYRDAGLPENEARYAALVEGVDASLGELLGWLDETRLADDTIVLFLSDNGGLSAHARSGPAHTHNAPLRSGKGSGYDGGTRVPFAVRWPGRIAASATCRVPTQLEDVLPTLCELAGLDGQGGDGRSLAPALRGELLPDRPLFWHHPHLWGADGPGIEPYSAVRLGDHKLLWFHRDGRCELYDVVADLGERHDLLATEPALAARLRELLRNHLEDTGAAVPKRADGAPIRLP
jgi:arylsulfatase A-like enzyme